MAAVERADAVPALLDVVPWPYGYAHSWALAWLINNDESRDRMLALLGANGRPPWTLSLSAREHGVAGARADLALEAVDSAGLEVAIAVETKVGDPIRPEQLLTYAAEGFQPVLFVPGLTGLLFAPNGPVADELWVTGHDLVAAMDGLELPWIIASYIAAVSEEAARMDDARAAARGEVPDFSEPGRTPYDHLVDAAWIVEVTAAMRVGGADDLEVRSQPNDRGVTWRGSWLDDIEDGNGAGLYVEVIADRHTHACAIAVKVFGGDHAGRTACYNAAVAAGEPSSAPWRRSRRPSRNSATAWKLDAGEMTAATAAEHALAAGEFIALLAQKTAPD